MLDYQNFILYEINEFISHFHFIPFQFCFSKAIPISKITKPFLLPSITFKCFWTFGLIKGLGKGVKMVKIRLNEVDNSNTVIFFTNFWFFTCILWVSIFCFVFPILVWFFSMIWGFWGFWGMICVLEGDWICLRRKNFEEEELLRGVFLPWIDLALILHYKFLFFLFFLCTEFELKKKKKRKKKDGFLCVNLGN